MEDFGLVVALQGAKVGRISGTQMVPSEKVTKDIRRATQNQYSAEAKIRIVLEGLGGEESIVALSAVSTNGTNLRL